MNQSLVYGYEPKTNSFEIFVKGNLVYSHGCKNLSDLDLEFLKFLDHCFEKYPRSKYTYMISSSIDDLVWDNGDFAWCEDNTFVNQSLLEVQGDLFVRSSALVPLYYKKNSEGYFQRVCL